MKNLIGEKPSTKLTGRLKRTFEFVDEKDIKGKIMLDIGCGYGWFERNALNKGAKKIYGAEISENDLVTIKKYIKSRQFIPFVGHATSINLKSGTIDTIVAWEVIEHIPKNDERKFFKEVFRLLKDGGTFYLSTPHDSVLSTFLDPAFWLAGHRHYTKESLSKYGSRSHFIFEESAITGGVWTSISVLNMYMSKWIFKRERFFNAYFLKKENMEYQKNGFYNIFIKYRKKEGQEKRR